MAKWKLSRQLYGDEEFSFSEGDKITIGRGLNNTITLSSIVISRNHCEVNAGENEVLITDLQSSNGIYVGTNRIPQNTPFILQHSDIIGFGCTDGPSFTSVSDEEKFVFKLIRESDTPSPLISIQFQNENKFNDSIEEKLSILDSNDLKSIKSQAPKRKVPISNQCIKKEIKSEPQPNKVITFDNEIINILSDSDLEEENSKQLETSVKKIKLESKDNEDEPMHQNEIKQEKYLEFEAFNVKQEYMGYDDGPIQIDSDSDTESDHWILRLSQNSPGKPFTKISEHDRISEVKQEDCSYSQLDDFVGYERIKYEEGQEDIIDDLITIPSYPTNTDDVHTKGIPFLADNIKKDCEESIEEDLITIPTYPPNTEVNPSEVVKVSHCQQHMILLKKTEENDKVKISSIPNKSVIEAVDRPHEIEQLTDNLVDKSVSKQCTNTDHCDNEVYGSNRNILINHFDKKSSELSKGTRKTQMIHAFAKLPQSKINVNTESKKKKHVSRHTKIQKRSHLKPQISSSEKEERRKKLQEIAKKEKIKKSNTENNLLNNCNNVTTKVKMTTTNRGAFLTNELKNVKPTKRQEGIHEVQKDKLNENAAPMTDNKNKYHEESKQKQTDFPNEKKPEQNLDKTNITSVSKFNNLYVKSKPESRDPLRNVEPIVDNDALNHVESTFLGKPFSKVKPLPRDKPKKKVRFSHSPPEIFEFEIEPGNKMKKTSLAKTLFENQFPRFSLEKLTLIKILRWNPHWLEEQIDNNDPPPILGNNIPPSIKLHAYQDHNNYHETFGALLLLEIWECLTIGYMKTRHQNNHIEFRIEFIPSFPSERTLDLFNINVNMSVPSTENRNVPRMGEIILVTFGPENSRNQRFFYVHSVRCLPSPPTNKNLFYSITLQAPFSGKMKSLKQGELIIGKNLTYIGNELKLFEAMEHLNESPLCDLILKPEPHHFPKIDRKMFSKDNSQWTQMLNDSQQQAVNASVSAALADRPSINLIQGPPGTGKSSVICAIIMKYLNNVENKSKPNRRKILICATSNTAVDELVIRLLNLRQEMPKGERFRMVRFGRTEAMHSRAFDVSSYQLAVRDVRAQTQSQNYRPAIGQEILRLEAKLNMWKSAAQEAKDPVRVAYCQSRVNETNQRIAQVSRDTLVAVFSLCLYVVPNVNSSAADHLSQGTYRCVLDAMQVRTSVDGNGVVRADLLLQSERRILEGADIILTTLSSAYNSKMKGLTGRIDLCIIDEAGQAIEPETLIPLMLNIKRLTLVGDPQQLPGFICSQRAKKFGLGESLFSRLTSCMEIWPGESPVILLQQQYRMHSEIADYPNRAFYDSMIHTVDIPRPKLSIPPYTVVSVSSGNKGQGSSGANEVEAWAVSRIVVALNDVLTALNLNLAVITPYNAHKELIKKNLKILAPRMTGVDVNTVDSFQGQERDVVVVSIARSQGVGFLTDTGRMNVMLTRAKHALIVCLNPTALLKNNQWRTLIEDAQRRNVYKVLPTRVRQFAPNPSHPEDILKYLTK